MCVVAIHTQGAPVVRKIKKGLKQSRLAKVSNICAASFSCMSFAPARYIGMPFVLLCIIYIHISMEGESCSSSLRQSWGDLKTNVVG